MFILILFSFLAGIVTILSPCILPILPLVLSSSLTGGKKRPFGVVVGFIFSFTFFTLSLAAIVRATGVDPDFIRSAAVVILLIFGLSLVIPKFQLMWEVLASKISKLAPKGKKDEKDSGGFFGGFFVGLSLGLIWTPCVGPIMASVLTLAATSSVTLDAVLITLAYSFGTAIPMLFIIFGGRALLKKVPFLLKNAAKIQRVFGVIIILLAIAIHFNVDRKFQTYVLEKFPQYGSGLTALFEDSDSVKDELDRIQDEAFEDDEKIMEFENSDPMKPVVSETGAVCDTEYGWANGFEDGGNWFNSEPLVLEELWGKVVLIDFWTYTCINCIRTLPFINAWHDKYADDGLVIVGVHSPEFEFEKKAENVAAAIQEYEIEYPVVQDNEFKIWRSYENRYWPAKYFIDKDGCVRSAHFGEGEYEESEKFIQELLEESGNEVDSDIVKIDEYKGDSRTHETYLGFGRIENFASPEVIGKNFERVYTIPNELETDSFAYEGSWTLERERAISGPNAALELNFVAQELYLVMRTEKVGGAEVKVLIDGEIVDESIAGEDVDSNVVNVKEDRLYKLIKLEDYENRQLRLEFDEGVEIFAFTFG